MRTRGPPRTALVAVLAVLAAACATRPPPGGYVIDGKAYVPIADARSFTEVGLASWYGPGFHGRLTANGERYDMHAPTAAHKLLPFGTRVRVTDLDTGRSVEARINDRGPFVDGRIIDLSFALAEALGMVERGTARVRIEALEAAGGAPPPGPHLAGPFALQVGAFTVADNARRLATSLTGPFDSVTVQEYDRGDLRFHRVRVGRFPSPEAARSAQRRLEDRGFQPMLVRID